MIEFPNTSQALTPWFPRKIRPEYRGYYEVRLACNCCSVLRFWNGKAWFFLDKLAPCPVQDVQWRGLAEKP